MLNNKKGRVASLPGKGQQGWAGHIKEEPTGTLHVPIFVEVVNNSVIVII